MLKGGGSKSDSNVEHLVSVILITQAYLQLVQAIQ